MKRSCLLVAALALDCTRTAPPPGQLLLFVDTDAPVPGSTHPLFDTLVVDVLDPTGNPCKECSRRFEVSAERLRRVALPDNGVSLGIPSVHTRGWIARLRLYDSHATLDHRPPDPLPDGSPPPSVIDTSFAIPTWFDDGILEVTAFLATEDVGLPNSSAITMGRPTASRVGSWTGTDEIPCMGEKKDDEVCVPGGAFWMGNPHVRGTYDGLPADIRRLVVLSPYFIGRTEVTVAQYRKFGQVTAWSGASTGDNPADYCTFTVSPGPHEDWPLNCVHRRDARAYCMSRGGDLPSEAQYEYVASDRRSALFVWGEDDVPACGDAVLGRGGWGLFAGSVAPCKPSQPPGGVLPVGSASNPRRDHATIGDDMVFDLVGNLDEWVLDLWNEQTEGCWSHGGVYLDPVCNAPTTSKYTFGGKGSAWYGAPANGAAAVRLPAMGDVMGPDGGFRCARPATE